MRDAEPEPDRQRERPCDRCGQRPVIGEPEEIIICGICGIELGKELRRYPDNIPENPARIWWEGYRTGYQDGEYDGRATASPPEDEEAAAGSG